MPTITKIAFTLTTIVLAVLACLVPYSAALTFGASQLVAAVIGASVFLASAYIFIRVGIPQ